LTPLKTKSLVGHWSTRL